MEVEAFIEKILGMDTRISYVAILDRIDRVLKAKVREPSKNSKFNLITPSVLMHAVRREVPYCGELTGFVIRYEKIVLAFYRMTDCVVVIGYEPEIDTPILNSLAETLKGGSERV